MNQHEEELQKKIESGAPLDGDDLDVKSYHEVFRVLNRKPVLTLSADFSDKVMAGVIARQKRSSIKDLFWLGLGIFFIVIAFVVAIVFTGFTLEFGFLKQMSAYSGVFVFALAFIGLLNLLDKRILRNKNTPDVSH